MPLDHYLPATFLASFSLDIKVPRRYSIIAAIDKSSGKLIEAKASKLARVKNLYSLVDEPIDDIRVVDKVWSDYESNLASALSHLILGTLDADMWVRILVPFVACLFIRGPDFNIRFDERLRELTSIEKLKDNTNYARLFELQRLLGPVLAADWLVVETTGEGLLITNDLGFAPFVHGPTGEIGISIPIGHRHILQLIPKRSRRIMALKFGSWYPKIRYGSLQYGNHIGLNESIARFAQRFMFGSSIHVLRQFFVENQPIIPAPEPEQVGFISGPLAIVHEFTWHRLVSFLEKYRNGVSYPTFELDWPAISNGWAPPVYLPTNLPEFKPSLRRKRNVVVVSFYEVDGFTN